MYNSVDKKNTLNSCLNYGGRQYNWLDENTNFGLNNITFPFLSPADFAPPPQTLLSKSSKLLKSPEDGRKYEHSYIRGGGINLLIHFKLISWTKQIIKKLSPSCNLVLDWNMEIVMYYTPPPHTHSRGRLI